MRSYCHSINYKDQIDLINFCVVFQEVYNQSIISYLYDPSRIYHYRILQKFIDNKNRIFKFFKNYAIYFNKINSLINPLGISPFEFF
jgi:hypothetical protein